MPSPPRLPAWVHVVLVGIVPVIVAAIGWLLGSLVLTAVDDLTSTGDLVLVVPAAVVVATFLAVSAAAGLLLGNVGLTPRVLVCWGVVAIAFGTLVALAKQDSATSSSLTPPTVGAYARGRDQPLLGNPSVVIHPDGVVELESPAVGFEDQQPRIIWYLADVNGTQAERFLPTSCRTLATNLYDCPAGDRITLPDFVVPLRTALAGRALAVDVAGSREQFSALSLTIKFPTYELDPTWGDAMSFDRVIAGNADLTSEAIVFRSEEQRASSPWMAAIAVRLNAAESTFSILRDVLLVILGGAVTLTLRPRLSRTTLESASRPRSQRVRLSSRSESRRRRTTLR